MFCIVGDDVFFGVVAGVGLVSVIDQIIRVFQQVQKKTCGHDKKRHFLLEEACFKRNHLVATGSLRASVKGCYLVYPRGSCRRLRLSTEIQRMPLKVRERETRAWRGSMKSGGARWLMRDPMNDVDSMASLTKSSPKT